MCEGFNPRSRTGNDGFRWICRTVFFQFQSTFPHGERRWKRGICKVKKFVSIHVPARGTTTYINAEAIIFYVSIHVPARGTTRTRLESIKDGMFQSTFPHGERPSGVIRKGVGMSCFNPRSRTGNDWRMWPSRSCFQKFQSTFPHGERHTRREYTPI